MHSDLIPADKRRMNLGQSVKYICVFLCEPYFHWLLSIDPHPPRIVDLDNGYNLVIVGMLVIKTRQ